jgi:hypothetical protein
MVLALMALVMAGAGAGRKAPRLCWEPRPRLRIEFTIIAIHVNGFRTATPVGS